MMKSWLRIGLAIGLIGISLLSIAGKGCNPWEKNDDDDTTGSSGVGPFDLIATAVSESQIDLTWKHDLDPAQQPGTGFELQRKTGAEGTYQTIATLGLVTSYEDTGLNPDTTYYYRVSAYHTVGEDKVQYSNWSNEAFATTQEETGTPAIWTQTTDTDFNGGTKNQVVVSGTSSAASVILDTESVGITWTLAISPAAWSARSLLSVVYEGKMWVIGGFNGTKLKDVWWSTDGINWTQATTDVAWSWRTGHTSVVYNNKMWVIGGDDGTYCNDVWWSDDGVNWTEATAAAPWSGRWVHTSVVYDGKMWVIGGGNTTEGYKNDVWWSDDGINWTEATAAAPWSARGNHTSVVHNGKMWVFAGYNGSYHNDVWWSTDGVNWIQATTAAAWGLRQVPSVVYDNKMWVIGGYNSSGIRKNDVWWSTDGSAWTQATAAADWSGRQIHPVVHNGKMWVVGGYDGTYCNDVWYNQLAYYSSGDLISSAKDCGVPASFTTISWTESVPVSCTLKFQLASNNDNATWDFIGPDGTNATYYTTSGASIHSSHDGDRYIRYKAYLSTTDTSVTPCLKDITISYFVP